MKTTLQTLGSSFVFMAAMMFAANLAWAQTTTTSVGTVREFSPDAVTITTDTSPAPVRYTFSKTTTYVDENGNPVSVETVRSGQPVTVYYDQDGDRLVASKVVVRKNVDASSDGTGTISRETTTTSTSSQGTVNSFRPDSITVASEGLGAPVTYVFTKTTTYVDENGNPISVETVKSGMPVTVYYDRDGDRMVASRVVVRNIDPNATVIEHSKTTTTTTETTSPNP